MTVGVVILPHFLNINILSLQSFPLQLVELYD